MPAYFKVKVLRSDDSERNRGSAGMFRRIEGESDVIRFANMEAVKGA